MYHPIELNFGMYAKWYLSNGMTHKKTNKTKLNQTKPNKTSFSLIAKFSAISYPIELKFGMYAKWYLSDVLKHKKNITKTNHTKPNLTK